ncbi:MAG: enoyl-CoA hydratase/isomerase family protein [Mycobacteriales bacterium]
MNDQLRYQKVGAVATITLARPGSLNALDRPMKQALLAAVQRAGQTAEVRAVVLAGEGRAFCVGQDLQEHAQTLAGGGAVMATVLEHYNPIVQALREMPKPVIAAVGGTAAGAGAALAFACDFRLATPDAVFLTAFARIALGPDSGMSWTLPRLVGPARATRLLLLAEPLPAPTALEWGAVDELVAADKLAGRAAAFAAELAAGPTQAYAAIKAALHFGTSHGFAETLAKEAELQARCGATEDHLAATEAFLAKTPVSFRGC